MNEIVAWAPDASYGHTLLDAARLLRILQFWSDPVNETFSTGASDWPSVGYRAGYPFAERYDRKDVPVFSKEPFIRNFWLLPTMHNSELLLNTSDLTRVKVLRPTGGTTQEFAYNLETVNFPDDLWLQDGDTIVVPDKEK